MMLWDTYSEMVTRMKGINITITSYSYIFVTKAAKIYSKTPSTMLLPIVLTLYTPSPDLFILCICYFVPLIYISHSSPTFTPQ